MRRLALIAGAVACFGLSAWTGPPEAGGSESTTTAIGRSLGGLRVLVVDVLFVRAGALVASGAPGDLAEAQSLYETVLELDPDNDAAHAFLVDMYAIQILPFGTTREDRYRWWLEGWNLAQRGLQLNPRSAHLHNRVAELLIDVTTSQVGYVNELLPLVDEEFPNRKTLILDHLSAAARITDNLPNRGRMHLVHLSNMVPEIMIQAARAGDKRLMALCSEVHVELLERRTDVLADMTTRVVYTDGTEGPVLNRVNLMAFGMNVILRVAGQMKAGDVAQARRFVQAYAEEVGQNRVLRALQAWVGE